MSLFHEKQFDTEHLIDLFAEKFVIMPADRIYEKEKIQPYKNSLQEFHIYLIGKMPNVNFVRGFDCGKHFSITSSVYDREYTLEFEKPENSKFEYKNDKYGLRMEDGSIRAPSDYYILSQLQINFNILYFQILYIGQAYGKGGKRSALDRLLKHETLQKISLKEVCTQHKLYLLFLKVSKSHRIATLFNPFAKAKDVDETRARSGLDKLISTSEKEQISLFEAAFIRYFRPKYNIEFKNSFPSTNMKILEECYKHDFSGVSASISFHDLPFRLKSDIVEAKHEHFAFFNLHNETQRHAFFGKE